MFKLSFLFSAGIHEETKLVPLSEDGEVTRITYSSLTELFYLTHKSLQLSYVALCERCLHLNEEIHHFRDTWQFIEERSAQATPLGNHVRQTLQRRSSLFFTYSAALNNPDFLERALRFLSTTAEYLCQLAINGFQPDGWRSIESLAEDGEESASVLGHMPEFVATNIVEIALNISRTNEELFEVSSSSTECVLFLN